VYGSVQRISKRKLFWLIFVGSLLIYSSNVWVSVSEASNGPVEFDVPVKGTYLHADPDQITQAADSVDPPGIIDLEGNGFSEGDTIVISFQGSVDRYGGSNYEAVDHLIGVFSSTNQLLSIDEAHRVSGAIPAGEDYETGQTWFSQEDTDIPEDFEIEPSTGFSIQIPQNAKYLFVSYIDSYYPDNTALAPIKVTVEIQTSPLGYILAVLGAVAVIAFLIFFFVLKRGKSRTQNNP
jgi:hypothetical protein